MVVMMVQKGVVIAGSERPRTSGVDGDPTLSCVTLVSRVSRLVITVAEAVALRLTYVKTPNTCRVPKF
jgi:hypothetical protein